MNDCHMSRASFGGRSLATVRISITDADQGITEQLNGESQESLCHSTLLHTVSHNIKSGLFTIFIVFISLLWKLFALFVRPDIGTGSI